MKIIDISYFIKAIHAAAQMGVKGLLIEPQGIRGIDEDRAVVFFQEGRLPFGRVAIGETIYLSKRLKVFKHLNEIKAYFDIKSVSANELNKQVKLSKEYAVSFKVKNNESNSESCVRLHESITEKIESYKNEIEDMGVDLNNSDVKKSSILNAIEKLTKINKSVDELKDHALTLHFSEGGINLKQKCVPPTNIFAPKVINDKPKYVIDIKKSHVVTLKSICTAVRTDEFYLKASKDGVFLNVIDKASDSEFNIKVGESDDGIEFSYCYCIKPFVQLLKSDKSIFIGEKGLLKATLDEFEFYLIPQY